MEIRRKRRRYDGRSKHPWYKTWMQHRQNVNCPWSDFDQFRRWAEARNYDPKAGDRIILHYSRLRGFAPRVRKPGQIDPIDDECSNITPRTPAGIVRDKLYKHWRTMMDRCYEKTDLLYERLGGLGVKVCNDWHEFEAFAEWAQETGGAREKATLLRRDRTADFSPGNCLWN